MKSFHQKMNDLRAKAKELEAGRQQEESRRVLDSIKTATALRDQFAMAALTGLLSMKAQSISETAIANIAYGQADAMLAARDIDTSKGEAA